MSELKVYRFLGQDEVWPDANLGSDYYLKSEADKVIADKDAEIARLKAVRKVHVEAIASMGAGLLQDGEEIRRLRRALWLARALRARDIQRWWLSATCAPATERAFSVWNNVKCKCLKKAEEYK